MLAAYQAMHREGLAHSIEIWQGEHLVGGLYGIAIGRLFFGESMFHRATDASKVALAYLIKHCESAHFPLIDCQMPNSHLLSMGAKPVPRVEFFDYLNKYRTKSVEKSVWQTKELTHRFQW
jgi:leucyl/phenylalanyl-tRNA--protein transferase